MEDMLYFIRDLNFKKIIRFEDNLFQKIKIRKIVLIIEINNPID